MHWISLDLDSIGACNLWSIKGDWNWPTVVYFSIFYQTTCIHQYSENSIITRKLLAGECTVQEVNQCKILFYTLVVEKHTTTGQ
jgi:hypothetical protein